MARYNTPVRDFTNKKGRFINYRIPDCARKSPYGYKTLQEGVTMFTRKKKNGSKLASGAAIRRSVNEATKDVVGMSYHKAFPPIKIV